MNNIENKVIVVAGASGGMGNEVCKKLASSGAKLAICSNDQSGLESLENELNKIGAKTLSMVIDVTDEEQVSEFFCRIKEEFDHVDILLNLAGVSIPAKVWEMEAEKYDLTMDVNLKGTFLCSKYFIPLVDVEKGARIINIGSMAAKRANAGAPLYCTAKAAVNMFSEGLALQVKEKNIQVTTLNPGPVDTTFWGDRPVAREKFMSAQDVAELIEYILNANQRIVFHEVCFESFEYFK